MNDKNGLDQNGMGKKPGKKVSCVNIVLFVCGWCMILFFACRYLGFLNDDPNQRAFYVAKAMEMMLKTISVTEMEMMLKTISVFEDEKKTWLLMQEGMEADAGLLLRHVENRLWLGCPATYIRPSPLRRILELRHGPRWERNVRMFLEVWAKKMEIPLYGTTNPEPPASADPAYLYRWEHTYIWGLFSLQS